jgi:hypothetical protein
VPVIYFLWMRHHHKDIEAGRDDLEKAADGGGASAVV